MKVTVNESKLTEHRAKAQRLEAMQDLSSRLSEEVRQVLYAETGDRTDVPEGLITIELTREEYQLLLEFDRVTYFRPYVVTVYVGDGTCKLACIIQPGMAS